MEKANGENAQVSFIKDIDCWIIASKNVSLLAHDRSDLNFYKKLRYDYAVRIANAWFDYLERYERKYGIDRINGLKDDLINRTIIGEYCGNPDYQHLVLYNRITIYFFGLVEHNMSETCLDVERSRKFFEFHEFDRPKLTDIGTFKEFRTLRNALLRLFDEIESSEIESSQEGTVVYLQDGENRVLSLCKTKTLEYRIYRKLREKLRNLIENHGNRHKYLDQFESEVENLCQHNLPPYPLNFYNRVAEEAFQYAYQYPRDTDLIHQKYIEFISTILYSIQNSYRVSPSQLTNPNLILKIQQNTWSYYSQKIINHVFSRIIFVLPIGIPGMGKSKLFEGLVQQCQSQYTNIIARIVSSDQIRADVMQEMKVFKQFYFFFFQKKGVKEDDLFKQSYQQAKSRFNQIIEEDIRYYNKTNQSSILLLLLDKNYTIETSEAQIQDLKDLNFSNKNVQIQYVAVIPKCFRELKTKKFNLPFSFSFVINCIYRVQSRKNHLTLDGKGEESLAILAQFISLFIDRSFSQLSWSFNQIIEHAFTIDEEYSDTEFSQILEEDFIEMMAKTPYGQKCSDNQTMGMFLETLNENKPDLQKFTPEDLEEKSKEFLTQIFTKLSIHAKNKAKKVVQFIEDGGTPLYYGLFVDEQQQDIIDDIERWVMDHLDVANAKFPDDVKLRKMHETFNNQTYQGKKAQYYMIKPPHITAYYANSKKPRKELIFESDKMYSVKSRALVLVPEGLITMLIDPIKDIYIENKYPHMTLYTDRLQPKDSNEVMDQCLRDINLTQFRLERDETKTEKVKIRIGQYNYTAYIVVMGTPFELDCVSSIVYKNKK